MISSSHISVCSLYLHQLFYIYYFTSILVLSLSNSIYFSLSISLSLSPLSLSISISLNLNLSLSHISPLSLYLPLSPSPLFAFPIPTAVISLPGDEPSISYGIDSLEENMTLLHPSFAKMTSQKRKAFFVKRYLI